MRALVQAAHGIFDLGWIHDASLRQLPDRARRRTDVGERDSETAGAVVFRARGKPTGRQLDFSDDWLHSSLTIPKTNET